MASPRLKAFPGEPHRWCVCGHPIESHVSDGVHENRWVPCGALTDHDVPCECEAYDAENVDTPAEEE